MSWLSIQLAVLAQLESPTPASGVADRLGVDEHTVEQAVTELEDAGLVEREGFGAKTRLVPVSPTMPRLADRVSGELSDEAWRALFDEERARVACVVHVVGRVEVAAHVLDAPADAVRANVYDLVEAGVLEGTGPF
jgi:DNA-binding Lrp family transcriptional regulator